MLPSDILNSDEAGWTDVDKANEDSKHLVKHVKLHLQVMQCFFIYKVKLLSSSSSIFTIKLSWTISNLLTIYSYARIKYIKLAEEYVMIFVF